MKTKITILLIVSILLAGCSAAQEEPTPTPVDMEALQTAAMETVVSQITLTAESFTATPTLAEPTATETLAPEPSITPTNAFTETPRPCDNGTFVSDVSVPDGTEMSPGQEFVKTWKVKNLGTCPWTTGYTIIFAYGDRLGAQDTALQVEIAPDTEGEISVTLKAPNEPGTYSGYFRLNNNNGYVFGEFLTVIITVK